VASGPHGSLPRATTRRLTSTTRRLVAATLRPSAIAGGLCLSLAATACSASTASAPGPSAAARTTAPAPTPTTRAPMTLQVTRAAYRLPAAISREVVLACGPDLLVIGGITQQLVTTGTIIQLNPVTGRATRAGQLTDPAHDAAGAVLGGRPYLFGGGDLAELAAVQALRRRGTAPVAGQLPGARSDISSVTLGSTAYLVGGYDGTNWIGAVLATTNGRTFRKVANLPVPVRYAAVAGAGTRIWVFGGLAPAGNSRVIQQVDLTTGKARVVGRMPAAMSAATAVTLDGRIFIAGGQITKGGGALVPSQKVLAYDPVSHRVATAGRLPVAVTNAAAAVVGGTAFLVGGNNGSRQVTTVAELRLVAG
jgi:hypothetical protein